MILVRLATSRLSFSFFPNSIPLAFWSKMAQDCALQWGAGLSIRILASLISLAGMSLSPMIRGSFLPFDSFLSSIIYIKMKVWTYCCDYFHSVLRCFCFLSLSVLVCVLYFVRLHSKAYFPINLALCPGCLHLHDCRWGNYIYYRNRLLCIFCQNWRDERNWLHIAAFKWNFVWIESFSNLDTPEVSNATFLCIYRFSWPDY